MARIQDVHIPYLTFDESASPGTPANGFGYIYVTTGGTPTFVSDSGTETAMLGGGGGGGGAPTTATYVTTAADGTLSAEVVRPWLGNYFAETKTGTADATYDDEFDDTSGMSGSGNGLAAKWNWRNQGSATATFTKQGWLTLSVPASSSSNWRILEIAGFADGTYEAKMSMECSLGNDTHAGIILIDATNGDFNICGFTAESGTRYFGVQKWTNVTTWAANTQRSAISTIKTVMYVRIVKSGTSHELWGSEDGIGWVLFRSWTDDVSATRIGLGANELTNDGKTKLHVDYFRKVA